MIHHASEVSNIVVPIEIEQDDARPLLEQQPDGDTTSDAPTKRTAVTTHGDKVLFLDGLRGLSAMVVIIQHTGFLEIDFGQAAVDMFFVLSAFLLTRNFERTAQKLLAQRASLRRWGWALLDYAQRRFLRVYPLFALTAVALSLMSPEDQKQYFYVKQPEAFSLWGVLTFEMSQRYFVFWTLPLEIAYYLIIPPLVVAVLMLGKFWWVPMGPLAVYITYAGCTWFRIYSQPLGPHLPTFLTGSLAAFVYTRAADRIRASGFSFQWHHKLVLRSVEMLNLGILLSVQFDGLLFHWVAPNPVPHTRGDRFVHANAAIVLVCEMLLPGALADVLEWALLRYLGKISFSVYLLHGFVVHSPRILSQKSDYDWFFSVWILIFLSGTVSYHLVEVPCFTLASRIGLMIKQRYAADANREAPQTRRTPETKSAAHAA